MKIDELSLGVLDQVLWSLLVAAGRLAGLQGDPSACWLLRAASHHASPELKGRPGTLANEDSFGTREVSRREFLVDLLLHWDLTSHDSSWGRACLEAYEACRAEAEGLLRQSLGLRGQRDEYDAFLRSGDWAARFGALYKASSVIKPPPFGALTPLTLGIPLSSSAPAAILAGAGITATASSEQLAELHGAAHEDRTFTARSLRILQWEVMPRDLVEEATRGRITYGVGTNILHVSGLIPEEFHKRLVLESWVDHSEGIAPSVAEDVGRSAWDTSNLTGRLGDRRERFGRLLAEVGEETATAYQDLIGTFGRLRVSRDGRSVFQALLVEDGELTFFSVLWILSLMVSSSREDPMDWLLSSRPLDLSTRKTEEPLRFGSVSDLLLDLGLAGWTVASVNREGKSVLAPTRRWWSFVKWLVETRDRVRVRAAEVLEADELQSLTARQESLGAGDATDSLRKYLVRLEGVLPVKLYNYSTADERYLAKLAEFFLGPQLESYLRDEANQLAQRCSTVERFVRCHLIPLWESMEGLIYEERSQPTGHEASTSDKSKLLLRLCRAPHLPLEYYLRSLQPYEMNLIIIPFNSVLEPDQGELTPGSLGFVTVAGQVPAKVRMALSSFGSHQRTGEADSVDSGGEVLEWLSPYWVFLGSVASEVASGYLVNQASRLGELRGQGAVLHQLPKDFRAAERSLGAAVAQLRKIAERHPELELPEIGIPDALQVISMFIEAASMGRLNELPESCAALIQGKWTEKRINELVDRVVWEQARSRVEVDARYRQWRREGLIPRRRSEVEELFLEKRPLLSIGQNLEFEDISGLYPLLLVTLRNAYQHALLAALDPQVQSVAKVEISRVGDNGDCIIGVYNTGQPAMPSANQNGWERDLETFRGLTGGWRVRRIGPSSFSVYDEGKMLWRTEIQYEAQV